MADKSVVEIKIRKGQSVRIILEGAEGFSMEAPYEDVVDLIAQKMLRDAREAKYRQTCSEQKVYQGQNECAQQAGVATGGIPANALHPMNRY